VWMCAGWTASTRAKMKRNTRCDKNWIFNPVDGVQRFVGAVVCALCPGDCDFRAGRFAREVASPHGVNSDCTPKK